MGSTPCWVLSGPALQQICDARDSLYQCESCNIDFATSENMLPSYSSDIRDLQGGGCGVQGGTEGRGGNSILMQGQVRPSAWGWGGAGCRRESSECVGEAWGSQKGQLCEFTYPEMRKDN